MHEPGLFDATEGLGPESSPAAARYIWGVDVSSLRISVGVDGPVQWTASHAFERPVGAATGERLSLLYRDAGMFAGMLARRSPPDQVSVESPAMISGFGAEPILQYATGVVVAAFADALEVPVWMVPVARWKKRSVGHGNATKDQVKRWALEEGFAPTSQDEADAAGVARAALETCWGGQSDEKDVRRGAVIR